MSTSACEMFYIYIICVIPAYESIQFTLDCCFFSIVDLFFYFISIFFTVVCILYCILSNLTLSPNFLQLYRTKANNKQI